MHLLYEMLENVSHVGLQLAGLAFPGR